MALLSAACTLVQKVSTPVLGAEPFAECLALSIEYYICNDTALLTPLDLTMQSGGCGHQVDSAGRLAVGDARLEPGITVRLCVGAASWWLAELVATSRARGSPAAGVTRYYNADPPGGRHRQATNKGREGDEFHRKSQLLPLRNPRRSTQQLEKKALGPGPLYWHSALAANSDEDGGPATGFSQRLDTRYDG
jgi:hypothetical protein